MVIHPGLAMHMPSQYLLEWYDANLIKLLIDNIWFDQMHCEASNCYACIFSLIYLILLFLRIVRFDPFCNFFCMFSSFVKQ